MTEDSIQVAVLGSGVSGLTTGVSLLEAGFRNVSIVARQAPGGGSGLAPLVSEVACALWLPMWTGAHTRPEDYVGSEAIWSERSFLRFAKLAPEQGVSKILHREYYTEAELANGLTIPTRLAEFLPNFHSALDINAPPMPTGKQPLMFQQVFETFIVEMPIYLPWLRKRFLDLGGRLQVGVSLNSLSDISMITADIYVNALGMGSAQIFGDSSMIGVKGQVVLSDPDPTIACSVGAGEFCLIPRRDALVLGSLYQQNFDDAAATDQNTALILEVVEPWLKVPSFRNVMEPAGSKNIDRLRAKSVAGIRPFRPDGVRLELEYISGLSVVHNYGHGGGGVSLSWGCAGTVAELCKQAD